ncbi:competence protein ComK [Solibacillus sp. MA9]|uniref:Competence protein ComK n=1 Tax=Solibacillus palustris TaxID=2908203 RepID=A0ABS9U8J2_9BACL|nr:competence protein ComK [Solibacillus sp. MA9]MCH7320661.1 competence protein ComK [Solibacillus sp. MA9]
MFKDENIEGAIALIPRYDDFGSIYTLIVKRTGIVKSKLTPKQLLDKQLRKIGSSLRGAKDAAYYLIGSTSMHPILLQLYPTIHVWLPTESMRNDTCAYLLLHHIINYAADSAKDTIVYGIEGFEFIVPTTCSKFANRFQEAQSMQSKVYCQQHFSYEALVQKERTTIHCAEMHETYLEK